MSEVGRNPTIWQTAKVDLAAARGRRAIAVASALVWMAFQWGWGNDILLPPIVATAFDAVDDGTTSASAVAATAAATAAGSTFWALTQTIDAIVVLSAFRLLPGITARISASLRGQQLIKPLNEMSFGVKFLIAYASGASLLLLIDVFITGRPGIRHRRRMLAEAVALSVGGVAVIVTVVAGLGALGTRVPRTAEVANTLIHYAENPLTWLLIYGTLVGGSAIVSHFRSGRRMHETEAPTP